MGRGLPAYVRARELPPSRSSRASRCLKTEKEKSRASRVRFHFPAAVQLWTSVRLGRDLVTVHNAGQGRQRLLEQKGRAINDDHRTTKHNREEEMLMAQLASMARTLSMARRYAQKSKTKKRPAQGTVRDMEKRVMEAVRARGRARSSWFHRFMAASDTVDKAVQDFVEHRISLRAASKTLPCLSCIPSACALANSTIYGLCLLSLFVSVCSSEIL